jgi:hypothetical protein
MLIMFGFLGKYTIILPSIHESTTILTNILFKAVPINAFSLGLAAIPGDGTCG